MTTSASAARVHDYFVATTHHGEQQAISGASRSPARNATRSRPPFVGLTAFGGTRRSCGVHLGGEPVERREEPTPRPTRSSRNVVTFPLCTIAGARGIAMLPAA